MIFDSSNFRNSIEEETAHAKPEYNLLEVGRKQLE
jgi:hypothetical protein